jgi:ParB-like chromosome segregation protein Spo0J
MGIERIPLNLLNSHPANPNQMTGELFEKLVENIRRQRRYPPLIVRPDPTIANEFQILDGHGRRRAVEVLGHTSANCVIWPCDDATAMILLATLNRLEGQDLPIKRAELLDELSKLVDVSELHHILPETMAEIEETVSMLDLDVDALLSDIEQAAQSQSASGRSVISFALTPEEIEIVEAGIKAAQAEFEGQNRRGAALALICANFREKRDA